MTPHPTLLDADCMEVVVKHLDPSYHLVFKLVCNAWQEVRPGKTRSVLADYTTNVTLLEWAGANGCPWNGRTCSSAARGGHLDVLKWLRANGCPWNDLTCKAAARGGHLDVLKWLRANGCPWNEWTCHVAAFVGHLDVLKWARANGCLWNDLTCKAAAEVVTSMC